MSDASELWRKVEESYDVATLRALTNVRDRSPSGINVAVGERAAADIVAMWPAIVQNEYDSTDTLHVAAAVFATYALLWRRGGTATSAQRVKWDEAVEFMERVRDTGPRAHAAPGSSSGVRSPREDADGRKKLPWSHRKAIPQGQLPNQTDATGY